MDNLREWFSDACNCNGNNNLYSPQLTCLDTITGSVTSTIHHDGDMTAQMLINAAVADIHSRDPPLVNLPKLGWIVFLNATNNTYTATSGSLYVASVNGKSNKPTIIISVVVSCVVVLLLILFLVGVILVTAFHKR